MEIVEEGKFMIHKKWIIRDILKNIVSIFILCLFAFLIIGCTSGPNAYRMVNQNNTNIGNLEKSKIGMTKTEVLTLMGTADKSETFERQGVAVEILYYLTSGSYSPYMGWQNIGSTPVVLEAGILKGWGKYYDEQRLGSPRIPKEQ
jgi:ABC-type dipeptide/oligopeptide/nickel transport system permease component